MLSLFTKAEGLHHCRGKHMANRTDPTDLTLPLLLNPLSRVFDIPAKAPGNNASGLGTCLLLYFSTLDEKITFQFSTEPFHSNLHRIRNHSTVLKLPSQVKPPLSSQPDLRHCQCHQLQPLSFALILQQPSEVIVGTSNAAFPIQRKSSSDPKECQEGPTCQGSIPPCRCLAQSLITSSVTLWAGPPISISP